MMVLFIILIIASLITGEFENWSDSSLLVIGTVYTFISAYNYFNQYLTIEEGSIRNNSVFSKKMLLSDVKVFKKFAGEYILKTSSKELRIDTSLIEPESLVKLDKFLADLKLSY